MKPAIVLVDIFAEIVQSVSDAFSAYDVAFMHGHPLEIVNSLDEMTKDPVSAAKKYPVIALFQDFQEQKGGNFTQLIDLNFIIAMETDRNYLAADRYTNTFKPYLYPIYDMFLHKISRSGYFNEASVSEIKHTKIDRLYWGRNGLFGNTGNIFNDMIDCIEIQRMKLDLKNSKSNT